MAAAATLGGMASSAARGESPADVARRAGLRVFEGRHLTLITDRPDRPGDGVADLPRLFDDAVAAWCRHYRLDLRRSAGWRSVGCIVVDRERFREAGLLPTDGSVPDFVNGFCLGDTFWLNDQSSPAYRRHLLLHEGVHAFALTRLGAATPTWYAEGIAEYLATHRLEPVGESLGPAADRCVVTPIPARKEDVEQLGRIERLQEDRQAGRLPRLDDVFALEPRPHRPLGDYAACWAAVALLAGHPRHREAFRAAERGPLDGDLTTRLRAVPGWDETAAGRDFAAFLDDLDYGLEIDRMVIDWSPGRPLAARASCAVAADRGWQHTGVSAAAGRSLSFAATGRARLGEVEGGRIESEPDGISLGWYRGRPIGRLLVAQWVEPGDRPGAFRILAEGAGGSFTTAVTGPLYVRLNERPGDLADNAGGFSVEFGE